MKPLSFYLAVLLTAGITLCGSFTTGRQASIAKDNTHYYYYNASNDTFDAWNTLADEIARQENITGAYVNTNPFGGVLLVKGYSNNAYPHVIWPSSYLYAHY